MKHRLVALAVLIGAALAWYAGQRPANTLYGTGSPPKEPTVSTQPPAQSRPAAPAPVSSKPPIWQVVDEWQVDRLPEYGKLWSKEGRILVRVASLYAESRTWRVGDTLRMVLPQLRAVYNPTIEMIDDGPGDSRAALGWFTDAGGAPRRVLVTIGPTSAFAFIDTQAGSYELYAVGDHGWLLPSASMMAGVDFSVPDYIVPEDG